MAHDLEQRYVGADENYGEVSLSRCRRCGRPERRYNSDEVRACVERVRGARSPFAALEELLLSYSKEKPQRRALGCLGVSAICEFGMSDPEVARIGSANSVRLEGVLKELVREAKTKGEIRASVNERAAARHLQATILGMKVMSRGGASPETLRDVAIAALEGMALQAK